MRQTVKMWLRGLLLLGLLSAAGQAFAIELQEAKAQGLVGEQRNGYLGVVVSGASAEVRELVEEVNRKRRQSYQAIAKRNGAPLEAVEKMAARKAYKKTSPGHYVQNAAGRWVQK